jgi:pyruvate dehydrogenase E2 component (dihydrolipoamide acetyltransferase)
VAFEIVVPMLGVTIEKGIIVEWLKKEGDPVEKGESIFVVEAEKVTTEVESPATGTLARIFLQAGEEVPLLTIAGVITEPGELLPDKYESYAVAAGAEGRDENRPAAVTGNSVSPPVLKPGDPVLIVPAARKLAQEKGIDIENLVGTGPHGVICLSDVEKITLQPAEGIPRVSSLALQYAEKHNASLDKIEGSGVRGRIMQRDVQDAVSMAAAPGLGKIIAMDSMRQVIARRMSESAFTSPHIYFFTDILMDSVLDFKQTIQCDFEERLGQKLSFNDLLIKAVALSIVDYPMLNSMIKGSEIHINSEVNISLAVALKDGLIVPAIVGADTAGLSEIVTQRIDLVRRAHSGKLTMDEIERGTFTISSLAQSDITHFTAILNPPQSGILSVGKVRDELYLDNKEVKSRKITTFGLSVDHRIIDGVVAANFLQNLKRKLEKPVFTFTIL